VGYHGEPSRPPSQRQFGRAGRATKEAFVFRCNFVRRNLSGDQKREARRKMKATAVKLRAENKKKWTNKRVADAFGVSTDTVELWFRKPPATNPNLRNGCSSAPAPQQAPPPDARVKLSAAQKEDAVRRVQAGEGAGLPSGRSSESPCRDAIMSSTKAASRVTALKPWGRFARVDLRHPRVGLGQPRRLPPPGGRRLTGVASSQRPPQG
jgi:hypothetical protein